MSRKEANKKIIKLIEKEIEKPFNEDIRFGQLLRNIGVVLEDRNGLPNEPIYWYNEFYLESEELLKRIKKTIKELEW
jgi:hypothetical protein